jgi:hypothetical protein
MPAYPTLEGVPFATPDCAPVIKPVAGGTTALAVGATSTQSAVIGAVLVRLVATCDCHIVRGPAPVALTTSMYLPANIPECIAIDVTDRLAVIAEGSQTGTLYITPAA